MNGSKNQIPFYVYFSWALAILSIFIFMIDLFIRAPDPVNPFIKNDLIDYDQIEIDNKPKNSHQYRENRLNNNEKCCIATIFDQSSIKQTIALGYSILNSYNNFQNHTVPKTFALFTADNNNNYNISNNELLTLEKYFRVINISTTQQEITNGMIELLFWTIPELKNCFPVVALTHNGIFNKAPIDICNSIPFSAVSKTGDIVFFDTSLMVLDPSKHPGKLDKKYEKNKKNKQFKRYINYQITDWKPLPTDLSVEDYNNDFLDFWLKYGTPTFIHFEENTFFNSIKGINQTNGSREIFKIIVKIINQVKDKHPDIFQNV